MPLNLLPVKEMFMKSNLFHAVRLCVAAVSLCALFVAAPANARPTIIVPGAETGGTTTPFRALSRVYQSYIDDSQFASLTAPTLITSFQLRISVLGNGTVPSIWPSQDLTFTNYTVQMSRGSAGLIADGRYVSNTANFASQHGANLTTVRSGGLTIPAGSFLQDGGGGINSFGFAVTFTTPYLYTPGEALVYQINHTGYLPGSEVQPFFASRGFANGVTDAISSAASATATNAQSFSSPMIVQFATVTVPEAGSGTLVVAAILFAATGVTLAKRRKK